MTKTSRTIVGFDLARGQETTEQESLKYVCVLGLVGLYMYIFFSCFGCHGCHVFTSSGSLEVVHLQSFHVSACVLACPFHSRQCWEHVASRHATRAAFFGNCGPGKYRCSSSLYLYHCFHPQHDGPFVLRDCCRLADSVSFTYR